MSKKSKEDDTINNHVLKSYNCDIGRVKPWDTAIISIKNDINKIKQLKKIQTNQNKNFDCSNGLQVRDFIYISDAIDFIYKIMRSKHGGKIFNIGSGNRIKVKKIINYIVKFCKGGKPSFGKIELRKDELINLYPSINLAKSNKWKPSVSLLKGLKLTISHYKNKNSL